MKFTQYQRWPVAVLSMFELNFLKFVLEPVNYIQAVDKYSAQQLFNKFSWETIIFIVYLCL